MVLYLEMAASATGLLTIFYLLITYQPNSAKTTGGIALGVILINSSLGACGLVFPDHFPYSMFVKK